MPDNDDPFFNPDDERTIIKPNPGGRTQRPSAPGPQAPAAAPGQRVELKHREGLNPIERSAALLLNLLSQIRNTSSHPNPSALHKQLATEISHFERKAQKEGVSPESIYIARYALCSIIDEFVMATPWGVGSVWTQQTLLALFHKEGKGGEKFFRLLKKLEQDPARNIDLLELLYLCLALGFRGRYAALPNGLSELEQVRESLFYTIRNQREEYEPSLSPHWEGLNKNAGGKGSIIPAWMAATIVLLLLVGMYSAWKFALSGHADPVHAQVVGIADPPNPLLPHRAMAAAPDIFIAPPPADRFKLAEFLAPEIRARQVTVEETDDQILVSISASELFESGSDVVNSRYHMILDRIGEGLEQTNGRIRVVGHTDNIPMSRRSPFASNFELSQSRADSVVKLLNEKVSQSGRMDAQGMGDTRPVADNGSSDGRARNRRVEIIVIERAQGI
jgi:type VI secretion system protein ImpK